jgi:hypothetical protein
MKRKELEHIKHVLAKIENPDGNVQRAIAYLEKDIAMYDSRRGQLQEMYDYPFYGQ